MFFSMLVVMYKDYFVLSEVIVNKLQVYQMIQISNGFIIC
ncbi:MAG: hypothetical protein AVDCRST_MAG96-3687 [uncultured Segetibacter sp.]|uniref:Uncharacterized protein n=1 Tax=uncultured Segetibacter sp. TaxID=481133 RepID=A0A6J4TVB9_9BACT|nr:MAG: hypothetical protein AVDCRST_MAG96-3687 [uncultured Segetibacter sp.]